MKKYKSHCRCGWPYLPDNRHVGEMGQMEDCKPSDNLEYLEFLVEQKEKRDETSRSKPR